MLENINIILSHTTHPGNIGATARAMKVMGLSNLSLVNPQHFPSDEATARASKASDILQQAKIFTSIEEAVADSRLIVGASARVRSLPIKLVTPRQLINKIEQDKTRIPISFLFGTENSGLTNEELQLCHYHLYIPTNPDYSSLNLASAVQIISYELYLAFSTIEQLPILEVNQSEQLVNRLQLNGLVEHFESVMRTTGYFDPKLGKQIQGRMNRLLTKADLTVSELNILRGFLSSVTQHCNQITNNGKD